MGLQVLYVTVEKGHLAINGKKGGLKKKAHQHSSTYPLQHCLIALWHAETLLLRFERVYKARPVTAYFNMLKKY